MSLDEREAPVRISNLTAIKRYVKFYKTLGKDKASHSQDALCITHTKGLLHRHEKPHYIDYITQSVL